ncbi:putative metallopeptidase family M24 [Xylona heveae TC161]|uniref:Xaa-Pro aminopeptidase n=1 Tax=Xylona heveae (strain CBS 132557 / TC161) TaxID=1328760 RepID=A0A165FLB4_XYLHT|nr:putative metallopeptidase family M24 [Xylona heveae TC161]KZF21111.1 putative metallopeptidase family M24 [Xylona heveae TC161]
MRRSLRSASQLARCGTRPLHSSSRPLCTSFGQHTAKVGISRRRYASVAAAELQFGQPLHETHPHILRAGEVTPGISALEYATRRARLAAKLPHNGIAIIASSDIKYRSGSVFYEFHQDSNFFYLTGFNEPEALAIIEKTGPGPEHIFHLYVRPKDPRAEQWEGARSGVQAALDVFNADEAGDINQLHSVLPPIVAEASEVYTDIVTGKSALSSFSRLFLGPSSRTEGFAKILEKSKVKQLRPIINDLRVIKSEAEIANMRTAGRASGRAFTKAMGRRFTLEKDLTAFLEYKFKTLGCDTSAYVPVVAGGEHALNIHYVRNDDVLRDGQLVLVDAGGEYGGYITDITRTWPVNGKFTDPQKELYEAILRVQCSCVSLCRASAGFSLDQIHRIAENGLRDALSQLGFDMSGNALETLFPHHLGHFVGLDVHDTPGYPRRGNLQVGQCVTIEPGIYVPDDERWPKHFRGIGIRIEDSVCVQEENPLVLTTEAVKEVVDIEALSES